MKNLPRGLTRAVAPAPAGTPVPASSESTRQTTSASSATTPTTAPDLVLVVPDLKSAEALQKAKAWVVRSTPGGGKVDIRVIVMPTTTPEDVLLAKIAALTDGDIIPVEFRGTR